MPEVKRGTTHFDELCPDIMSGQSRITVKSSSLLYGFVDPLMTVFAKKVLGS